MDHMISYLTFGFYGSSYEYNWSYCILYGLKSLIFIFGFVILFVCIYLHVFTAEAQFYDTWSNPSAVTMSMWAYPGGSDTDMDTHFDFDEGGDRRSLYWKRSYYISYGALSANRVPCPPRSGRSYYTHDCYFARGPVHPYSRGCSSITRCRR
ncbi:protein RALF-like 22 [Silene latifolia]|uniref:protein RALF-like 22 n=1 Tax=Silene latifolia TaxID=37657 RepID=UPI003D779169